MNATGFFIGLGTWELVIILFVLAIPLSVILLVVFMVTRHANRRRVVVASTGGDTKPCPFCAEQIQARAIVCRFCKRDLKVGGAEGEEPQ